MVVALVVCALVIVALVASLLRLRARADELARLVDDTRAERDRAGDERAAATARADELAQERDDALERVNRARRDAAEVANRLRDETNTRTDVERELTQVRAELEAARTELVEAAAAASVAVREPGEDASRAESLWALMLRQVEHTWRVSVALGSEESSPLEGDGDPFRTAVEIEVDAAREEGGAAVDLVWSDDAGSPEPEQAAVALALVRDLIATLGTSAGRTKLTLALAGDGIEVGVEAVDDAGAPIKVELPAALEIEPGRARIT